ncbi:MAG: GspH/FimT family pseudopilin [Luteimonas sp.]
MRQASNKGFTLIELMVVIAIVAILLAFALPSFEGTMRSNRVGTATNELMASFSLARSEAVRSARGGSVCASADGSICGGTWNNGWIVMDINGAVVRYVQGKQNLVVAVVGGASATTIAFDNRGRPDNNGAPRRITLQSATCPSGDLLVRTVTLNNTGQMRIAKGACP